MGAPAGPAVEHLRLTSAVQRSRALARRKKVAFTARGEVFAAVGEGRRRRGARHDDAGRGSAARLVARQPPPGLFVGARWRSRLVLYDFTTGTRRRSPPRQSATTRRGSPRRQVDRVRPRRHRAARASTSRQGRNGSLAKGIIADTVGVGRPARLVARRPLARLLLRRHARVHQRLDRRPPPAARAEQVSFLANANANAIAWSPDGTFLVFDTGQRTEPPRSRAST